MAGGIGGWVGWMRPQWPDGDVSKIMDNRQVEHIIGATSSLIGRWEIRHSTHLFCWESKNAVPGSKHAMLCSKVSNCRQTQCLGSIFCGGIQKMECFAHAPNLLHNTAQYYTIPFNAIQYYTRLNNTTHYLTIPHNFTQYQTILNNNTQCTILHNTTQ